MASCEALQQRKADEAKQTKPINWTPQSGPTKWDFNCTQWNCALSLLRDAEPQLRDDSVADPHPGDPNGSTAEFRTKWPG